MLQDIQKVVVAAHLSLNSLKDWFPPVNDAARRHFKGGAKHRTTKLIAKYMRAPEEQQLLQRREASDRVVQRNRRRLNVDYQRTTHIVRQWIASKAWHQKLLGVMAACGPRKTAVLDPRIKFKPAEEECHDSRYWVRQVGVLKDCNQAFEVDDEGECKMVAGKQVEKPIAFGLTYDDISAAVAFVRDNTDVEGLTRKDMGNKYNKRLVKIVKEAFPGPLAQEPRIGTHLLRAIYANVAYRFFSETLGQSLTSFISEVLAHNSTSLTTALSYQTINIHWGEVGGGLEVDERFVLSDLKETVSRMQQTITSLRDASAFVAPAGSVGPAWQMVRPAPRENDPAAPAAPAGPPAIVRKRKRGVDVGTEILLRMDAQTYKPYKKPKILRGDERRQQQVLEIVRDLLAKDIRATRTNLRLLGLGRGKRLRAQLQWAAEMIAEDEEATEAELAWAKDPLQTVKVREEGEAPAAAEEEEG
jgi:hypothetical protein